MNLDDEMDRKKTTPHLQDVPPLQPCASREVWGRECGVGVLKLAVLGLAPV